MNSLAAFNMVGAASLEPVSFLLTMRDGVRLNVRHFPAPGSARRAVVCLPGLTRNGRDFDELALSLSDPNGHRRAVYTINSRGRGGSERDPDWRNYTVLTETADVLDTLSALDLHRPAIVGTSRGGILAMVAAVMRPTAIGPVVLNDIGPVLDLGGVTRIAAYAGRVPVPTSWPDAARVVREMNQAQFTALDEAMWMRWARKSFNDRDGRPEVACDPGVGRQMSSNGGNIPTLWPQFVALSHVPVLTIRGANSDLLSAATVVEMQRRHPALETFTVPNQGHAPLLTDGDSIGRLGDFLIRTDSH